MLNRRLHVEPLEDRRMLAVATVDTHLDVVDLNDGVTSLREAIFAANTIAGPDTIEFDPVLAGHTILLEQGELEITDSLTIQGLGQELLTVDAQQLSRILHISATSGDFTLSGIKLTRGSTYEDNETFRLTTFNGGAIYSQTTGLLSIEDSLITESFTKGMAAHGGGVFAIGDIAISSSIVSMNHVAGLYAVGGGIAALGTIDLFESLVTSNHTEVQEFGYGGGIYGFDDVTISSSKLSGNYTSGIGGLGGGAAVGGDFSLLQSTVTGNKTIGSSSPGGGIFVFGKGNISNSTISDNFTSGDGSPAGGISVASPLTIANTAIINNRTYGSSSSGGGLETSDSTTIVNTTVSGNVVSGTNSRGGGIFAVDPITVINSTITKNHSTSSDVNSGGGGVYLLKAALLLSESIVSGNTAGNEGPNIFHSDPLFSSWSITSMFSVLGTDVSTKLSSPSSDNTFSNDPQLGPLQNNGGPTLTHAPLPGSPAIDAGDPAAMAGVNDVPLTDQRGGLFTRVYGGRIDIGAVEVQPLHADFDDDGDVDGRDFLAWQRGYSRVATATHGDGDANGDQDVDGEDLGAWQNEYGAAGSGLGLSVESLGSEEDTQLSTLNSHPSSFWIALPESRVGRSEAVDEFAIEQQVLPNETATDRVFADLGSLTRKVDDELGDLVVHRPEEFLAVDENLDATVWNSDIM